MYGQDIIYKNTFKIKKDKCQKNSTKPTIVGHNFNHEFCSNSNQVQQLNQKTN